MVRENYQIGVPVKKTYELQLSSDDQNFGGSGIAKQTIKAKENITITIGSSMLPSAFISCNLQII